VDGAGGWWGMGDGVNAAVWFVGWSALGGFGVRIGGRVSREGETEVVVEAKTELAEGVVGLTLRAVDGGALPGWSPGAHIDVVLGDGLVRQYSQCGDPGDSRTWRDRKSVV